MKKIVVLVSGGGTNLQALIDAQKNGLISNGTITCVISSKENVYALERAKQNQIATRVIPRKEYPDVATYTKALTDALLEEQADLVVYAGFMTILDEQIVRAFPNKMMNVHPALIPSFCGKGYYGLHVHEAALAKGVKLTGATVHFVTEVCDGGPIILQKAVPVLHFTEVWNTGGEHGEQMVGEIRCAGCRRKCGCPHVPEEASAFRTGTKKPCFGT